MNCTLVEACINSTDLYLLLHALQHLDGLGNVGDLHAAVGPFDLRLDVLLGHSCPIAVVHNFFVHRVQGHVAAALGKIVLPIA